jgi:hypothetical protein
MLEIDKCLEDTIKMDSKKFRIRRKQKTEEFGK